MKIIGAYNTKTGQTCAKTGGVRKHLIVIGYGTGRCGTKSLAAFLDNQKDCDVTHEKVALGWYQAFTDTEIAIRDFVSRDSKIIGDVGFYWINYLDLILRKYKGSKAINIWRDDEEVIESYWSYMRPDIQDMKYNQWKGYPYDSPNQTKDAIAFTIQRYRFLENEVRKLYPYSIFTIKTDALNNSDVLDELLEWLGINNQNLNPVHINTREQILNAPKKRKGRLFNVGV